MLAYRPLDRDHFNDIAIANSPVFIVSCTCRWTPTVVEVPGWVSSLVISPTRDSLRLPDLSSPSLGDFIDVSEHLIVTGMDELAIGGTRHAAWVGGFVNSVTWGILQTAHSKSSKASQSVSTLKSEPVGAVY